MTPRPLCHWIDHLKPEINRDFTQVGIGTHKAPFMIRVKRECGHVERISGTQSSRKTELPDKRFGFADHVIGHRNDMPVRHHRIENRSEFRHQFMRQLAGTSPPTHSAQGFNAHIAKRIQLVCGIINQRTNPLAALLGNKIIHECRSVKKELHRRSSRSTATISSPRLPDNPASRTRERTPRA